MRRLFAEAFTVSLLEPEQGEPEVRYDEERCLNVMSDGSAFIETGCAGRTDTLTEVRAEQDDFDGSGDGEYALGQCTTITKVKTERDDFATPAATFATETRQTPGERDDFCRSEIACGTETNAAGESDDFARGEWAECPQPYVRRVTNDFARGDRFVGTKTSVRGEVDDFSLGPEEIPSIDVVFV